MTSDFRREFKHHESDIQAIVGTGFPRLRGCTYLLLRVMDARAARAWIARCLPLVRSVANFHDDDVTIGKQPSPDFSLTLAFSYEGLKELGLEESAEFPFPSAFRTGMADPVRAPLFGDEPDEWQWGGNAGHAPHVLVIQHARANAPPPGSPMQPSDWQAGFRELHRITGCPAYIDAANGAMYEPFGFRDGIGQPVIRGMRESRQSRADRDARGYEDRIVAPGEFLLGHVNEYGEIAQCPDVNADNPEPGSARAPRFGFNGSYLVMRQYEQYVEAFNALDASHPVTVQPPSKRDLSAAPFCPATLAEKMIGRKRDGTPLVPRQSGAAEGTTDAFRYRNEDATGFLCPRGAHSRRADPRDMLGWDVESGVAAAKLHRILRRGRAWTNHCKGGADAPCGSAAHRDPGEKDLRCGQGIVFIALNADLERQYEFIQQHWLMNRRFAGLVDESDPILGPAGEFSMPAPAGGNRVTHDPMTRVLGGAYFFLPGMSALRRIAGDG